MLLNLQYYKHKNNIPIILIMCLIFIFGYKLIIAKVKNNIEIQQIKINSLHETISTIKSKIKQNPEFNASNIDSQCKTDLSQNNLEYQRLNISEQLLVYLDKLATESQIKIISLKPFVQGKNINNIYVTEILIRGTYRDITKFMQGIKQIKYITLLTNFTMQPVPGDDEEKKELFLSGILYSYKIIIPQSCRDLDAINNGERANVYSSSLDILKSQDKNKKSILKSAAKTNTITAIADPFLLFKNKPDNLTNFSCNEFKYAGFIIHQNTPKGILIDPLGAIYYVNVGDKIGINYSKIKSINATAIVTTDNNKILRSFE